MYIWQQECIPVGCMPSAAVAVGGGRWLLKCIRGYTGGMSAPKHARIHTPPCEQNDWQTGSLRTVIKNEITCWSLRWALDPGRYLLASLTRLLLKYWIYCWWKPLYSSLCDVSHIFSVDSKILARDLLADTNIEVSPDGTVSWTAPALFKSSCNINIGKCHGSCYSPDSTVDYKNAGHFSK